MFITLQRLLPMQLHKHQLSKHCIKQRRENITKPTKQNKSGKILKYCFSLALKVQKGDGSVKRSCISLPKSRPLLGTTGWHL
jgi:hypothetical protein